MVVMVVLGLILLLVILVVAGIIQMSDPDQDDY